MFSLDSIRWVNEASIASDVGGIVRTTRNDLLCLSGLVVLYHLSVSAPVVFKDMAKLSDRPSSQVDKTTNVSVESDVPLGVLVSQPRPWRGGVVRPDGKPGRGRAVEVGG